MFYIKEDNKVFLGVKVSCNNCGAVAAANMAQITNKTEKQLKGMGLKELNTDVSIDSFDPDTDTCELCRG